MALSDKDQFMVNVLNYPPQLFAAPQPAPTTTGSPAPAPSPLPGPRVQQPAAGPTVTRDAVEQELVKFLTQVQKNQGGQSVKIDQTVLLAADAVAHGDNNAKMAMSFSLKAGENYPAAALAHKIASALQPQIPAENLAELQKFSPKDLSPKPKSVGDALGEQLEGLIKKLPKAIQDPVRKAVGDAIAAGVAAAANAGMKQAGVGGDEAKAISSAIEAALREKGKVDKQQDGAGSPDAHPAPGPTPPSGPPAPGVPGETIVQTPKIKIPDTPPAPKADAGASQPDAGAPPPDAGAPPPS